MLDRRAPGAGHLSRALIRTQGRKSLRRELQLTLLSLFNPNKSNHRFHIPHPGSSSSSNNNNLHSPLYPRSSPSIICQPYYPRNGVRPLW